MLFYDKLNKNPNDIIEEGVIGDFLYDRLTLTTLRGIIKDAISGNSKNEDLDKTQIKRLKIYLKDLESKKVK